MRNAFFAILILLFAIVVTGTERDGSSSGTAATTGGSGGGSDGGGSGIFSGGVSCALTPIAPRRDAGSGQLVAGGRYRCDNPGAQVAMTVTLQKQAAGGQWTTVASQRFNASGANTTRRTSEEARTHSVTAACGTGTFRTLVEGVSASTNRDGRNVQKSFQETRNRSNPCA